MKPLYTQRMAMAQMGPARLLVHRFLWTIYQPLARFAWARRLWGAYRRTWPRRPARAVAHGVGRDGDVTVVATRWDDGTISLEGARPTTESFTELANSAFRAALIDGLSRDVDAVEDPPHLLKTVPDFMRDALSGRGVTGDYPGAYTHTFHPPVEDDE